MEYIIGTIGMLMFIVCYCFVFELCYTAYLRKKVKKNQEVWDKIKAELIEKGADNDEIADEYLRFMALCDGCYPSM